MDLYRAGDEVSEQNSMQMEQRLNLSTRDKIVLLLKQSPVSAAVISKPQSNCIKSCTVLQASRPFIMVSNTSPFHASSCSNQAAQTTSRATRKGKLQQRNIFKLTYPQVLPSCSSPAPTRSFTTRLSAARSSNCVAIDEW